MSKALKGAMGFRSFAWSRADREAALRAVAVGLSHGSAPVRDREDAVRPFYRGNGPHLVALARLWRAAGKQLRAALAIAATSVAAVRVEAREIAVATCPTLRAAARETEVATGLVHGEAQRVPLFSELQGVSRRPGSHSKRLAGDGRQQPVRAHRELLPSVPVPALRHKRDSAMLRWALWRRRRWWWWSRRWWRRRWRAYRRIARDRRVDDRVQPGERRHPPCHLSHTLVALGVEPHLRGARTEREGNACDGERGLALVVAVCAPRAWSQLPDQRRFSARNQVGLTAADEVVGAHAVRGEELHYSVVQKHLRTQTPPVRKMPLPGKNLCLT